MTRRQAASPTDRSTQRRRPGRFPGRRAATLVVALVGAGVLAPISSAVADDPVLVIATVYAPEMPVTTEDVTVSQLRACARPFTDPTMTMEQWGPSDQQEAAAQLDALEPDSGTWSLASALACMYSGQVLTPILPQEINQVTVFNGDSPQTPLMQDNLTAGGDLTVPSGFADQDEVPVVMEYGLTPPSFYYYRPVRPGGGDANALDTMNQNDAFEVAVYEAKTFKAAIDPPGQIIAGQPVSFAAMTQGVSPGDVLQYDWSFDGQALDSSAASPQVSFPTGGSFQVELSITDVTTDEIGAVVPLTVTVADTAAQTTSTTSGTGTTPVPGSGAASSGPSQSSGSTPSASAGAATTPGSPGVATSPSVATTSAAASTRTPTTPATRTHTATAPTTATRTSSTRTAAASASAPGGTTPGTGATAAAGSATSGSAAASGPTATAPTVSRHSAKLTSTTESASRPTQAGSQRISGLLISDVGPLAGSGAESASQPRSSAHAPGLVSAGHTSLLAGFAAGAGALMLVGFGVGQELRGRRPRWTRSPTA